VFLPWFQQQPGPKLFPMIRDKSENIVSRWLSYTLKRIGIKMRENSLHSLRHTLTQKLARARTYPPIQNRLLGHSIEKSVEENGYMASLEFSVKELSEALEKIQLPFMVQ
jgi:integrase